MKPRKVILIVAAVAVLGAGGYVFNWMIEREKRLSPADPAALSALISTEAVQVSESDWFVFEPVGVQPTTGFIFYPGGECDERGYAELLHAIAAEGYLVVLVPMPLQLAVLAPNKAEDIMEAFPEIQSWAIGGHSLGGAMAARFVYSHPEVMDGLLFWDAYPPETDDISGRKLKVRLIHRSDESGEPPDYYAQYIPMLPDAMEYRSLAGASHINFGRFLPAERFRNAEPASMPIDQQHDLIVNYTTEFLSGL
jgi:hypothetical protein